jgi:predicted nucleic acid-binding Zn ribbon protein
MVGVLSVEGLEEHKHCAVCGAVISHKDKGKPGKAYVCSEQCSKTYDKRVKKVKRIKLLWYLSTFIVLVPLAILALLFG